MGSTSSQPVAPATQSIQSPQAQQLPSLNAGSQIEDLSNSVVHGALKRENRNLGPGNGRTVDERAATGLTEATRRRSAVNGHSNETEPSNKRRKIEAAKPVSKDEATGDTHKDDMPVLMTQTSEAGVDGGKVGKKRRRHTGRPSNLAIAPPAAEISSNDGNTQGANKSKSGIHHHHRPHDSTAEMAIVDDQRKPKASDLPANSSRKRKRENAGTGKQYVDSTTMPISKGNTIGEERIPIASEIVVDSAGPEKKNRKRKRRTSKQKRPDSIAECDEARKVETQRPKLTGKTMRRQTEPIAQHINSSEAESPTSVPVEHRISDEELPSSPPIPMPYPTVQSPIYKAKSTGLVKTWLDNHIGSDMTGGPVETSTQPNAKSSTTKKTKLKSSKGKAPVPASSNPHRSQHQDIANLSTNNADQVAPGTARKTLNAPTKSLQRAEMAKGKFTSEEREIADNVFADVCRELGVDTFQLAFDISSWTNDNAQVLAKSLKEALPRRDGTAIRKFSQRKWHNSNRGPWSAVEDASLGQAWHDQPNNWGYCSEQTNRTPADCRDRWRNHLMYKGQMELGPWSLEEEDKLREAVEQCINDIKKANVKDRALCRDRERLEKLLHWQTISKIMGDKRSAKRCNEKWVKLRKREKSDWVPNNIMVMGTPGNSKTLAKKLRDKSAAFQKLLRGDKLRILEEIANADSSGEKTWEEESTFWSIVAQKAKQQKVKSSYNTALRRMTYYEALELYPKALSGDGTIAAKAKELAQYMARKFYRDGKGLPQADPALYGRNTRPKVVKSGGRDILSKEIVDTSESNDDDHDDDDDGAHSFESQDRHQAENEDKSTNSSTTSEAEHTISSLVSSEQNERIQSNNLGKQAFINRLSASKMVKGRGKIM